MPRRQLSIPHQGVTFSVTGVCGDSAEPRPRVTAYLYTESGSYLGQAKTTDTSGQATFRLPGKSYKVRADSLCFSYWSTPTTGEDRDIAIPEALAEVTVTRGEIPVAGVPVYVFTPAGTYLGVSGTTGSDGTASFRLPAQAMRFRADVHGRSYVQDVVLVADQRNPLTISTGGGPFTLAVEAGPGEPLTGLSCHLFSETGTYLGVSHATDATGRAVFQLSDGTYRFRVDSLGHSFWTDAVCLPGPTSQILAIPRAAVSIRVVQAGEPQSSVTVHLLDASGSYLGLSAATDGEGSATFTLPEGKDYRFRADLLGNQYLSGTVTVSDGPQAYEVDTGGGDLAVQWAEGPATAGTAAKVYLFGAGGSYLGRSGTFDAAGRVTFAVPSGSYAVRCDYLGYAFWSDTVTVTADTVLSLAIPHQEVVATVSGEYGGTKEPLEGVAVSVFTEAGAYVGLAQDTDASGRASFYLPVRSYKLRADYLSFPNWSTPCTGGSPEIVIAEALAHVSVTRGAAPVGEVAAYVFNPSGAYLGVSGTTDSSGSVDLRLPAERYNFRADVQGNQYWSGEVALTAGPSNAVEIPTGGGSFVLRVEDGAGGPIENVRAYLFGPTGTYLGASGTTSSAGEVGFDLSAGSYAFRVDRKGYSFWTGPVDVPAYRAHALAIPHRRATVAVRLERSGTIVPAPGVPVFLFTESGTYLGEAQRTDENGEGAFVLPERSYRVRADYLSAPFWSAPFTDSDPVVTIPEGEARVSVVESGSAAAGAPVYVFNGAGVSLGLSSKTDEQGTATFWLPAGAYRFRADIGGAERFGAGEVSHGRVTPITIEGP